MTEFTYACTSSSDFVWDFSDDKKKEPFWKDLPQKKQTHTLTDKDVKDWTRPWRKEEKEKVNGN